ncbi:hypothetical protein ACWEKT_39085 [Nocardia takedensis]
MSGQPRRNRQGRVCAPTLEIDGGHHRVPWMSGEETAQQNSRATLGEHESHDGEQRRDRSAITGHFVEVDTSRRLPDTTVTENR